MIAAMLVLSLGQVAETKEEPLLYTRCGTIAVTVSVQDLPAARRVADADAIEAMLESRLRAARLYEAGDRWRGFVAITVSAVPDRLVNIYGLSFAFYRNVINPDDENRHGPAAVWRRVGYGYFGETSDPAPGATTQLSSFTDEFIRDYLRENQADCS